MKSAFLVLKFTFLLLFSERVIEMSNRTKYDEKYYANLQKQVHYDPYGNKTHTHYPSNTSTNANVTLFLGQHGINVVLAKMEKYLQTENIGFKLILQDDSQKIEQYEIVQGKDGKKRWKTVLTGGKRHTRSSRKKRSKRTVRKQRK
jgi:hypothetical protein